MTFIVPYCKTGSFINEVLSYSKLCYFGPLLATLSYSGLLWATLGYSGLLGLLWATLSYSELLWTTLAYFNWFMDFGLRMTQGYQLDHSLSQRLF